jgi:hypothetical protein
MAKDKEAEIRHDRILPYILQEVITGSRLKPARRVGQDTVSRQSIVTGLEKIVTGRSLIYPGGVDGS